MEGQAGQPSRQEVAAPRPEEEQQPSEAGAQPEAHTALGQLARAEPLEEASAAGAFVAGDTPEEARRGWRLERAFLLRRP
jgi:hypothetical protein